MGHVPRGRGGGVSILIRDTCKQLLKPVLLHEEQGILYVSLTPKGCRPIHVVCCYLPPGGSAVLGVTTATRSEALRGLYGTLTDLRATASRAGADFILTGDLNSRTGELAEVDRPLANWDGDLPEDMLAYTRTMHLIAPRSNIDSFTDPCRGPALLDFCANNGLAIMNGRMLGDEEGMLTYASERGCSVVDYVITNVDLCFTDTGRPRLGSELTVLHTAWDVPITEHAKFDHAPLLFSVVAREAEAVAPQEGPAHVGTRLRFNPHCQAGYAEALQNSSTLPRVMECEDGDSANSTIQEAIVAAATAAGMARTRTGAGRGRGPRQQPWFDSVCRDLRDAHREAARLHGTNSHEAKQAHRTYFRHIQRTKRAWQEKELKHMADTYYKEPAKFWRDWKAAHGRRVVLGLDHWTDHFKGILGAPASKPLVGGTVDSHCNAHDDMFPLASAQDKEHAADLNTHITVGEVEAALKQMKAGKAAGVDHIQAEFLTHSTDPRIVDAMSILVRPLTHVFNRVFAGSYPTQWATCALTPVPKKGGPQDPNNYRGIAREHGDSKTVFSGVVSSSRPVG